MAVCKGRCSIPTISQKIRGPWTVQYLKITLKKQQQTSKNNNNNNDNVLFSPQKHLSSTSMQVKRPSSISSCPLKTDETIALVTEKVRKMDARFVRNRTWISSSRKFIGREDFLLFCAPLLPPWRHLNTMYMYRKWSKREGRLIQT